MERGNQYFTNPQTWSQGVVKTQDDLRIPIVDVLLDSFDSYLFHSFVKCTNFLIILRYDADFSNNYM